MAKVEKTALDADRGHSSTAEQDACDAISALHGRVGIAWRHAPHQCCDKGWGAAVVAIKIVRALYTNKTTKLWGRANAADIVQYGHTSWQRFHVPLSCFVRMFWYPQRMFEPPLPVVSNAPSWVFVSAGCSTVTAREKCPMAANGCYRRTGPVVVKTAA